MKLDVRTTTLLKGLGILLIVGHNFQYLASDLPGVNEFVFERENVDSFFELLTPASFVRLTIAYLGHYGVQLFIFLSAYGLTLSIEKQSPRYGSFVKARLVRLYPAFVLAIIAWALWKGVPRGVMGPLEQITENGRSLAWKLSLLSNLVRGEQLSLVGPWWFLPFIFQFYLVFPLLLRLQTRGLIAVSVTSLALTVLLNEFVLPGGFVYATPLGHVPEFCVGIWWARTPGARVPSGLAIVALGLFLAGNWWLPAWYGSHLSLLVLGLAMLPAVLNALARFGPLEQLLEAVGALSMQLFLVNGFLRSPFFASAKAQGTEFSAIGWGLISFGICVAFAMMMQKIEEKLTGRKAA